MAGKFEPKVPVQLNPPKDDPISLEELAQANGRSYFTFQHWTDGLPSLLVKADESTLHSGADNGKCYVAIKVKKKPTKSLTPSVLTLPPGHRLRRNRQQSLPARRRIQR